MQDGELAVIQLELKYCERCGGLFLRRLGVGEVFCGSCSAHAWEMEPLRKSRKQPRLPVNLDGRYSLEVIGRVVREGGKA